MDFAALRRRAKSSLYLIESSPRERPVVLSSTAHEPVRDDARVSALRGASPVGVAPRFWVTLGAVALVACAILLVVSFASAASDNARIERLKSHGIIVNATVQDCIGNLGGSGSNASSYTCRASYRVGTQVYREVVGAMSSFASPGSHVTVVADPSRASTIELASAVTSSSSSNRAFLVPGVLSALYVALVLAYLRLARRRGARDEGH